MTVREFTSRVWYSQKIIVIKWKNFDYINKSIEVTDKYFETIKEQAEYVGTPHKLRSVKYDNINEMLIDSYGVMNNVLIIEVH